MSQSLCRYFFIAADRDKWVATCDFQQCGSLKSVDSDKPVQPRVKLRSSKLCSVNSLTVVEYSSD